MTAEIVALELPKPEASEAEAKFLRTLEHTREALSDLCGLKVEDLAKQPGFDNMARSIAICVATIRALSSGDLSEIPPVPEFDEAPLAPEPEPTKDRYRAFTEALGIGYSKESHMDVTRSAMQAARSVVPLEYGMTVILYHLTEEKSCTISNLADTRELARFLENEADLLWMQCGGVKLVRPLAS